MSSLRVQIIVLLAAVSISLVGCNSDSTQQNQTSSNSGAANKNASATTSSNSAQPKIAFGSLEITSKPAGARILLIVTDEGGAAEPQPKGITPTTLTNLSPGKYTVDLEYPGYKYFQQKVEVKENSTAKVNAVLKKS